MSESSPGNGPQPPRPATRSVRIGTVIIGGGHPVAVQSMCAVKTRDADAVVDQVNALHAAGADVVRIAVDSEADARALPEIRARTEANLSIDLQENYRLAERVAPYVDKLRYNPGHLYHHQRQTPWQDKVKYLVEVAVRFDCALRVGVNSGSVDPALRERFGREDKLSPMLQSAEDHCRLLDDLGFARYCVSLKDSDPQQVLVLNRRFAELCPEVPLHLGVTEAGMPPEGVWKTRQALEPLLREGIGDTIRVSLTVPNDRKHEEIAAGRAILENVVAGRSLEPEARAGGLNIISCPSCARVENEAFVELAQRVREITRYAAEHPVTIAVMGCRVNGPGETNDADLGLWCGPNYVNLKRGPELLGRFSYDAVLDRLRQELDRLIAQRQVSGGPTSGS